MSWRIVGKVGVLSAVLVLAGCAALPDGGALREAGQLVGQALAVLCGSCWNTLPPSP